jgi:hypothetical protein
VYRRSIFAFDMLNLNETGLDGDGEEDKRGGKVLGLRGGEHLLNCDVLNGKIGEGKGMPELKGNENDNVRSAASTPAKEIGKYQYPESLRAGYKPAPAVGHARSQSYEYMRNASNDEQIRPATSLGEGRNVSLNATGIPSNNDRKVSGKSVGHSKSSSQGSLSGSLSSSEIMTVSQMYNGLMSGR